MKNLGILASSADPQRVGKTVVGAIVGASVFIIWILQHFGIQVTGNDVTAGAEQIGALISELLITYGLIQKLVIFLNNVWATKPDLAPPTPVTLVSPDAPTV